MSKFNNVMIDLETLSELPNAAVVAIGAVAFNMDNDSVAEFYINVNPRDCKEYGMDISESTVAWWRKQNPEATRAWITDGVGVVEAGERFVEFMEKYTDKQTVNVWANGIDFDLPILKNLLRLIKAQPWLFWNQYDARTIFKLAQFDTKTASRVGKYHNALDDCNNQIRWIKAIVNGSP
jgi:inhibitor of KinA sporulation pathway (predicted exonuclease)